jgi:hypothetical protein
MNDYLTSERQAGHSSETHHRHAAGVVGRRVAAESSLSRYLTTNQQVYLWKGMANPAAQKIKAKLAELGVE